MSSSERDLAYTIFIKEVRNTYFKAERTEEHNKHQVPEIQRDVVNKVNLYD